MIEYELFKISTSEDDDEDRERPLTEEEWKAMQAQFGDMTPEEMQAIREDMGHTQYPQIPYENIPEANRPDISAFEDAFPDDDDSAVQKLYKAYALNKENGDDQESSWSPDDLRNPYEEHKFDQSLYQQTGMDRLEAVQAGLCAKCTGKSGNYETGEGFTDDASRREYGITGYCQQCQDDFYGSLPPDEPMEKFYKAYVLK